MQRASVSLVCFVIAAAGASAQTNTFIGVNAGFGGFWDEAFRWSQGTPAVTQSVVSITNQPTKLVLIDAVTPAGSLTISNLLISAPGNVTNVLSLENAATPLRVLNSLTITSGGALQISNSTVRVDGMAGGRFILDGVVSNRAGGSLVLTNVSTIIGTNAAGRLDLDGGAIASSNVVLGAAAGAQGTLTIASGVMTVAGSTASLAPNLDLGNVANATGTVLVSGGELVATNGWVRIGNAGIGQMTVTGGALRTVSIVLGLNAGAAGTLTVDGGAVTNAGSITVGSILNASGTLWLKNGQFLGGSTLLVGVTGNGQVTVSNGTMAINSLVTVGSGAGSRGAVLIHGGSVTLAGANALTLAASAGSTGEVWVTGGSVIANSGTTQIGSAGSGSMTTCNAVVTLQSVLVGNSAGSSGTLTIAGGTNSLSGLLRLGAAAGATGTVWVSGVLDMPANGVVVGNSGVGQMTISNGAFSALSQNVGVFAGSSGTFTIAGGSNSFSSVLTIGPNANATGTVWMTGGFVDTASLRVSSAGVGQMAMSNGIVQAGSITVAGPGSGGRGTLTMAGGTASTPLFLVGNFACDSIGVVNLNGGSLFVTNAAGNAVLEVRSGTLTLNAGALSADQLVLTNACARFIHAGGSFIAGTIVVTPSFDADGDGIPNFADPGPFDPTDTGNDPDGDGFTNLQEFLAGTDPTNSASFLGITGIAPEGDDIRVTWMTTAGKTNALERTAGDASGNYSNDFSAIFTVTNTVGATTNYLDLGAATNVPALYYRVRLVP
jgi:T5SS/PEP-CTERM-associated repeat protein